MTEFKNINIQIAHDYFKEIVYQAANLEDKNITYKDTYNTLEFYDEAIKTIPYNKVIIITSLKKAYEYVIERANSNQPITYKDAMELNRIIDSYESNTAGSFRNYRVRISGCTYIPKIHTEAESIDILNEHKSIKIFEDGAKLCAYWSKMQLFGNGNKRTALCFANLCLLANNQSIIVIKNRREYGDYLCSYYDNESKLLEFVMYLKKCSIEVDMANPDYRDTITSIPNLGSTPQKVMTLLTQNCKLSAREMAQILGLSERQIQRALSNLTELGNIKHNGSKKTGYYEIVEKIKSNN